MEQIETPRLLLRGFTADAGPGLFRILEHPRNACFYDEQARTPGDAEKSAIERGSRPDGEQVAVWLKDPPEMIGYLFGRREGHGTWSVGWNFAQGYGSKGYATEAARAYIDALFNRLGARRVCAFLSTENAASIRLCQRLGMRLEGCFREYISFVKDHDGNDIYEDSLEFAILKNEWNRHEPGIDASMDARPEPEYRFGKDLLVSEYQKLRKASGWPELPDEEARSGLSSSSLICSCHLGEEIIGAVRLLWDHGYIAYFSDLMVMPSHQGKGIGRKLASMVLDWIGQKKPQGWKIKVVLISTPGNEGFYRKLGFIERPAGNMGAGMDLWLT